MIQAVGAPFKTEWSSNSYRVPETFLWTKDRSEIQVYIDTALVAGSRTPKSNKKFGWFCESRIVRHSVFADIKQNIHRYKQAYCKIFTCDHELLSLDSDLFIFAFAGSNLPWTPIEQYGIPNKSKMTSLLASANSSTEGHRNRIQMALKFKDSVDLYGGIFGSNKIGISGSDHYHHKSKTKALADYRFTITIENFKYDTYFTEKATDCFANGVIPVYYGTDKIRDSFDADGIIFLNEEFDVSTLTTELYQSKMKSIHTNLELVKQMRSSDDYLFDRIKEVI